MKVEEKREIQPVCKKCFYRRLFDGVDNKRSNTYWQHTACHYILDTGKRRDGIPKGDYCPNFKPRED